MTIQDKSKRLFECLGEIFSIGLPEDRDIRGYHSDLLWYADLCSLHQCRLKGFDQQSEEFPDASEKTWLWVKKEAMPDPPQVPPVLEGWLDVDSNPLKLTAPKPFGDEKEPFEDRPERVAAFEAYRDTTWSQWSDKAAPVFQSHRLYDQLFSLHQRLSIEDERFEVLWGHLFLTWQCNDKERVYHPLFLTPLNLTFDIERRILMLTPSESTPTWLDLGCIRNLPLALGQPLHQLAVRLNSAEEPVDVWDNSQMSSLASLISGYLYNAATETMNKYTMTPVSSPPLTDIPTFYNAPVIFVRIRSRRKWVDDAHSIAELIAAGVDPPPFIKGLVLEPGHPDYPDPIQYREPEDEDEGEPLLPLEFNDQQQEILSRLKQNFGVLVQGPPGTGKSHTIANIISSLLARGKRVLVTSQTVNALKVLRGLIPEAIRCLCVGQLGNDAASNKELTEAVNAVGAHLHQQNSSLMQTEIGQIREELRQNHEEQARLRSMIRDWAALDAMTIDVDDQPITAHQAAKECAEGEDAAAWFPDSIRFDTRPPMNTDELTELCVLLKSIPFHTRSAAAKYFPELSTLVNPSSFSSMLAEWTDGRIRSGETEAVRLASWGSALLQAAPEKLESARVLLEQAGRSLPEISSDWQQKILKMISDSPRQNDYWRTVRKKCSEYRDEAWQCYRNIQQYRIDIPDDINMTDAGHAIAELDQLTRSGKNPASWFYRLILSKTARLMLAAVTVDGKKLVTAAATYAVRRYHRYHRLVDKITTYWNQSIYKVNGRQIRADAPVPLDEIDSVLACLDTVFDWHLQYGCRLQEILNSLGCKHSRLSAQEDIVQSLKIIDGQIWDARRKEIEQTLKNYTDFLFRESRQPDASPLISELMRAAESKSQQAYEEKYQQISGLCLLSSRLCRIDELKKRLEASAPLWCARIIEAAETQGAEAIPANWQKAWRWHRLNHWLTTVHNRESVETLQIKLAIEQKKEKELITRLVAGLTWQRQMGLIDACAHQALVAWKQAVKNLGAAKGKYAQKWMSEAARAMKEAVKAVPVWIMPLHKVVESFSPAACIFDVVIIDEASQCDLRALSAIFRARKVLVVGDPEQISPSNVGINKEPVYAAISARLSDISNSAVKFNIDSSLFEIAEYAGMQRILLTEHFRCVPQIIGFSNLLCPSYNGRLEPLRQPNPAERLDQPIHTVFVDNGCKNDDNVNEPEAHALVETLVDCCNDDRYHGLTMGIISLLGEQQAKYIANLVARKLSEVEIEKRRINCGDAYAFQGDQRNVMFLSLVIAGNTRFAPLVKEDDRRRFNVASSRARDQVFLFHSVSLDQIANPQCVRYKLLNWYLHPPAAEMEAGLEALHTKAESPFEIEVGEHIIRKGYKVIPQYGPFGNDSGYRIDLVVQGEKSRIAVECDGDRWYGADKWEYDQRREAQLCRTGWKFWRISGSTFYRNKDKSLESLWTVLHEAGIDPSPPVPA